MIVLRQGNIIQPTYDSTGNKITGLVNPDGTTTSFSGGTSKLRCVVTRTQIPNTVNATRFGFNFRTEIKATEDLSSIMAEFPNWYSPVNNSSNELTPGGAATLHAAIEFNGAIVGEFKFNGSTIGSAADGDNFVADTLNLSTIIPAGDSFFVRGQYINAAGTVYHTYSPGLNDGLELSATTSFTDKTLSGTIAYSSTGSYAPLVIAQNTARKAYISFGDSIAAGNGDIPNGNMAIGIFSNIANYGGYINASVGSNAVTNFNTPANSAKRRYLAKYADYILTNFGYNDIAGLGQNANNVITALNAFIALFPTTPVYVSTPTQATTSTDRWCSPTNQTLTAQGPALQGLRERMRRGASSFGLNGVYKVLDVASATDAKITAAGAATNESQLIAAGFRRSITDGAITSGASTLTSASAAFTSADNGCFVVIMGAGGSGAALLGVLNVTNGTTATITTPTADGTNLTASTTVSGATVYIDATVLTFDGLHLNPMGYNRVRSSGVVTP